MAEREKSVVRGADGSPQVRRVAAKRWSAETQRLFFEHLCATCNVQYSVRKAGMTVTAAYARRWTDPKFRQAWGEVLEEGYARLETMLIARAGGTEDAPGPARATKTTKAAEAAAGAAEAAGADPGPLETDGDAHGEPTEALDSQLALQLLAHHRHALHGGQSRRGATGLPSKASLEEIEAAIAKRLAALNKRRGGQG